MDEWFRTPAFAALIDGMLASSKQVMSNRLNISLIRQKWNAHKKGQMNCGLVIWKYLYLTRWYQLYFE
jgi:hypothetical protein